ncbi:hypothetical protein [Roseibium sediminicola]|uniref:Uncharacterized protein n=1 Tax=Roseibium sediminicola TaxID=2933272 RepID=A0ABT0GXS5_9HYPH|nr:hypothetical protein [Roseibium sp. CAU 1639]MCK7614234.1 hypothetical protein [Roseibium sp. CAU 1639]
MMKRTEEMKLSSAGLLLLLTAAAMTLFADFGPKSNGFARAPSHLQHSLK